MKFWVVKELAWEPGTHRCQRQQVKTVLVTYKCGPHTGVLTHESSKQSVVVAKRPSGVSLRPRV